MPRTTFSITAALVALLIFAGFRLWLYLERRAELAPLAPVERLRLFWVGFRLDGVIVSRSCALVVLSALLLPDGLLAASRPLLWGYLGLIYFLCCLGESCGLYFFRYYDCRPNHLVFEHGADREVIKTVLKAYPVARIVLLSLAGAAGSLFLLTRLAPLSAEAGAPIAWYWDRLANFAWLLIVGFATRGTFDHRPLNPSFASISNNRIANEIALSGIFNLLYEWNYRLKNEFTALKTILKLPPADEVLRCVKNQLSAQGRLTDDSPNPLVRLIQGRAVSEPLNVVLVVMESFTGRLTGCLGGRPALSPELDRLAAEGVLLERCYATGERTIQALEAAVSSFPPLPGAGVVKRPQARQGFATLAGVLKERDYETLFLYGGQGIFDQMRAFFLANGFDRFIEEKDFVDPAFRSTWGVSDEDLFHCADQEFRRLDAQGRPFCATILTVSLHSPWEYPPERIRPLPAETEIPPGFEREELHNFLYADYAVGKFIREARGAPYFDKTLFVFVGDHGVHLRGADLVPIDDYVVPALFFCPAHLPPGRLAKVASQIDLPPTIMGILGGDYRSPFFGSDVLRNGRADPFAIVIYNKRRYGIVSDRELIVFPESAAPIGYERDGSTKNWRQLAYSPAQAQRAEKAVAMLRVAEDLLVSGRYVAAKGAPIDGGKAYMRSAPKLLGR
jgi:phosphoglycerol transferase MdoB-like AlkP superfamily enzyme